MKILDGGLLSTIQDLGRFGYQHIGVTPSGALDTVAHRIANHLVANEEGAATIEATLRGPAIEFTSNTLVAICGAQLSPTIADVPVPNGRAIAVRAGAVLRFGRAAAGARAYIAVAGGIATEVVMGSRSTHLRAGLGGYHGRALQKGDELPTGTPSLQARDVTSVALERDAPLPFAATERGVYEEPPDRSGRTLRFVWGPHARILSRSDRNAFITTPFEISPLADRMGYRLRGAALTSGAGDLLSTGVTWGTIQLPPSGEPIILMADRQTTGGYPMVATIITADLGRLAQMRPGATFTFSEIAIDGAQHVLRDQARHVAEMKRKIEGYDPGRSEL